MGEHPSMSAASSISMGMDFTKPQNMKTASPAPKPRYTMMMPQGVESPRRSATSESVNMTIWNGTTMESTHRRYTPFVKRFATRVMNHAHIEQQMRITRTEPTVMKTVQPTASRNP